MSTLCIMLQHTCNASMSYAEEDTCMSYEEDDTCMSCEEADTCMQHEKEDTCMSYEEDVHGLPGFLLLALLCPKAISCLGFRV
jgi:hypothetical protein